MARVATVEGVYSTFRNELIKGMLRPGERLGEESLATRWNVGRVPVREALLRLEQDGVVIRKPKVGTFIRAIDEAELVELYDLRIAVESMIARRAAQVATDAEITQLIALASRLDEAIAGGTVSKDERLHRAFHSRLADISRYKHAPRILKLTHLLALCSRFNELLVVLGSTRQVTPPSHSDIAAAVAARDPEGAAKVMREHLENKKQRMIHDLSTSLSSLTTARAAASSAY